MIRTDSGGVLRRPTSVSVPEATRQSLMRPALTCRALTSAAPACPVPAPRATRVLGALCMTALLLFAAHPAAAAKPAQPGASSAAVESDAPASAPASPTAVVLYPHAARVTVEDRVTAEPVPGGGHAIRLPLPAGADPATLTVAVRDNGVAAITLREVEAPEAPRTARLRAELAALRRAFAETTGAISATEARMALWSKPPVTNAPSAELERLDAQMSKRLAELNGTLPDLHERQAVLAARIARLEQEVNDAGGGARTAPVATVLLNAPVRGAVPVSYAYTLRDAGWRPTYRLEALPDKGMVSFTFEAEIRQGGSVDWTDAQLSVATVEPDASLRPPTLREWQLRPVLGVTPMPVAMKAAAPMMMESAPRQAADAAPMDEKATYEVWTLGQRTLPAGGTARVALRNEQWPVTFRHTVRPAVDQRAYLTAALELPEAPHYPAGEALFLVDGASMGTARFALADAKAELFFGSDPLVSATMHLDERKSGREGIVNKQQTRIWAWTIEVANRRARAVAVRVEDAQPQSRDTGITLSVESAPAPTPAGEDHKLVWNLDVPPRTTASIRHTVKATAPADMRLDDGR